MEEEIRTEAAGPVEGPDCECQPRSVRRPRRRGDAFISEPRVQIQPRTPGRHRSIARPGVDSDASASARRQHPGTTHQREPPWSSAGEPRRTRSSDVSEKLEELRMHLTETSSGQGRLLLLVGEPGIGKTRTIRELAAEAHRDGVLVLWGRGYEGDWSRPYGLWVEALAGYRAEPRRRAAAALLGPAAELLLRLVPGPDRRAARRPDDRVNGGPAGPVRTVRRRHNLLRQAARERTVLLVLDDLHWADRDSLALLSYVARELPRPEPAVAGRA